MSQQRPFPARAASWGTTAFVVMILGCAATHALSYNGISVDSDSGWDRSRIILGCESKPSSSSVRFEYLNNPPRVRATLTGSIEGLKGETVQVGDSFLRSLSIDRISRSRFQITAYLAAPVDRAEFDYYNSSRMKFAYIDIPRPSRFRQPWWTYSEVRAAKSARIPVVVIDPGHGGYDPGAISRFDKSLMEKEVALDISRAAVRALKEGGKVYPVMTRSGDYYPTLDERVDLIRNTAADLFVSVHADSAPGNGSANGFAVWTLDRSNNNYRSKANQTSFAGWKTALAKYPSSQQSVMMKRQADFVGVETEWAARIMTACLDRVPNLVNRGVKPHDHNLVVLRHDYSPSILIEAGFLSNSGDSKKLSSRAFRERIGQEIARGIEAYFEQRDVKHRRPPIVPTIKVASYAEEPVPHFTGETFLYRVKPNETLSGLAQRFRVTKEEILVASGKPLNTTFLYRGEELRIPKRPSQTSVAPPPVIRSADRAEEIVNRLPDSLRPDAADLGLSAPPGTLPYRWETSDTLLAVALRHGITEQELIRLNGWQERRIPGSGETIQVPIGEAQTASISTPRLLDALENIVGDDQAMAAPPPQPPFLPEEPTLLSYTVRPGDTLSGIADAHGVTVREIRQANGLRSDLISARQVLKIPANQVHQPVEHAIRRGESLEKLAKQYGTSVPKLKELNGLKGDRIQVGDVLRVR